MTDALHSTPDRRQERTTASVELTQTFLTRRSIASIDDLADHVMEYYAEEGEIGVFFRREKIAGVSQTGDTADPHLYLRVASFLASPLGISRFETPAEMLLEIARLRSKPNLVCHEFDNLVLFAPKHLGEDEDETLATLLISFYLATDIDRNQVETAARLLVRKVTRAPNGLADIAQAVAARPDIEAGYYVVATSSGEEPLSGEDMFLISRPEQSAVTKVLDLPELQADARGALKSGLSFSGRVQFEGRKLYYNIVPVILQESRPPKNQLFETRSSIMTKERVRLSRVRCGAIVLISKAPIDAVAAAFASQLIEEYVGVPSHAEKIGALHRLAEDRARVQLGLLESPFDGAGEQRACIERFAQAVCVALVKVTAAHSATVRLFDPFRKTLDPVGAAFCSTLAHCDADASPIAADDDRSLNAFVFRNLGQGEHVYIRDVQRDIPEHWVLRGLAGIKKCRSESRSELCLPIFKTGLCIGALNVEAPNDYGFDRDLRFIDSIGRQLGDFVDVVTRTSDAGWLPRLTFMHFTAHQIEKSKIYLRDYPPEVLAAARAQQGRMSPNYIDPKDSAEIETSVLIDSVRNFIAQLASDIDVDPESVLQLEGAAPRRLSARHAHSLEVILENILENAKHHDDLSVPLVLRFAPKGSRAAQIQIRYFAERQRLFPHQTDRIGIAPRWDEVDDTFHMGTFLAGVHARLLGGVMWVDQTPSTDTGAICFQYVIEIPLDPDERARQDEVGL